MDRGSHICPFGSHIYGFGDAGQLGLDDGRKAVQTVSPMTCSTLTQGTSPPGVEPSRLVKQAREARAAADEQLASQLADVLEVLRALAEAHGVN